MLVSYERRKAEFVAGFMDQYTPSPLSAEYPKKIYGEIRFREYEIVETPNAYIATMRENRKKFTSVISMAEWIYAQACRDDRCMLIRELKEYVIRPALTLVGLWSQSAETLLAGTIMVESGGERLKQIHGPALGLYQIEPATHKDIQMYLDRDDNETLKELILEACRMSEWPLDDALVWNLRYATLIARTIYRRDEEPLPSPTDALGMARYHKRIFNTSKGKARVALSMPIFDEVIRP